MVVDWVAVLPRGRPWRNCTMSAVLEKRMGRGEATRERILEIAETAVLAKGFGATSIDEVIAEAGLTKSGFFYHFKDKNALARESSADMSRPTISPSTKSSRAATSYPMTRCRRSLFH
jgi:hypothetical protein